MMGIAELAGEYHRSVELLEDRLTQLKEEIKTARGPHYFDLKQRIELLRFELVDTRRRGFCMTTTTKFTPRPLKRVARCISTATLEFYIPREESGPSEERLALRRLLQYGCTRCLTPAQQQLTRLRYTDGLTVTAIAEQMGLAPSSVSRSLGVIRQRLYRFTEEAGEIGQLCDILRRQLQ